MIGKVLVAGVVNRDASFLDRLLHVPTHKVCRIKDVVATRA